MVVLVPVGIEREISVHTECLLCERDASKRRSTLGGMSASGWSANGTHKNAKEARQGERRHFCTNRRFAPTRHEPSRVVRLKSHTGAGCGGERAEAGRADVNSHRPTKILSEPSDLGGSQSFKIIKFLENKNCPVEEGVSTPRVVGYSETVPKYLPKPKICRNFGNRIHYQKTGKNLGVYLNQYLLRKDLRFQ